MKNLREFEDVLRSGGRGSYSLTMGEPASRGILVSVNSKRAVVPIKDSQTINRAIKRYISDHGMILNEEGMYLGGFAGDSSIELNTFRHFRDIDSAIDFAMYNYSEIHDLHTLRVYTVDVPAGIYSGFVRNEEIDSYRSWLANRVRLHRIVHHVMGAIIPLLVVFLTAIAFIIAIRIDA